MESGELGTPLWAHNLTWTRKLACMHHMCLCAQAHISAKLGQMREIKVFMESVEHAGPLWAHYLTKTRKLACMHPMWCVHRPISQPNFVGLERSKYLWNQENRPDLSGHILHPKHTSLRACMLYACMLGPISQPNGVGSERWRYLSNWKNIPDLYKYILHPKHAS